MFSFSSIFLLQPSKDEYIFIIAKHDIYIYIYIYG